MIPSLSLRIDPKNPDHHLWNNNGTWWLHLSLREQPWLKARRLRQSLATACRRTARQRRDAIIAQLEIQATAVVSAAERSAA
jgi:hypothetical protein